MIALKRFLASVLLLALFLTGCRAQPPEQTEFFTMDTLMNLKLWGDPDGKAAREVVQTINALASALSVTDAQSEIARLNETGSAALSEETAALLAAALELSRRTDGAFDPTVYPLVRLWGFTGETQAVPGSAELQRALAAVGTENVLQSGQNVTLRNGAMLDFGGIAKGYAAEKCAKLLEAAGIEAALLSLGGNVQTVGTKPDGSAWAVGIADPENPTQAIATLTFTGSLALVTSGGYQRYFEEDGVRYHHILDPKTGYPARSGLASVTILAESGTLGFRNGICRIALDGLRNDLNVQGILPARGLVRRTSEEAAFRLSAIGCDGFRIIVVPVLSLHPLGCFRNTRQVIAVAVRGRNNVSVRIAPRYDVSGANVDGNITGVFDLHTFLRACYLAGNLSVLEGVFHWFGFRRQEGDGRANRCAEKQEDGNNQNCRLVRANPRLTVFIKMISLIHICRLLSHLFSNTILLYALPLSHLELLTLFVKLTSLVCAPCKVILLEPPVVPHRQFQLVSSVTV